jgi:hypothetical protein
MTPIPTKSPCSLLSDFIAMIQEAPGRKHLCLITLFEGPNIDLLDPNSFPGKQTVDSIKSLAQAFDPNTEITEYWDRTDKINTVVSVCLRAFGPRGEDHYIGSCLIECSRFTL